MSNNYGPGISRVLDPTARAFQTVIFQQGKPPMDSEFVLATDLVADLNRKAVMAGVPSGWIGNETNLPTDFKTDASFSNYFKFGSQRAAEKQAVMWAVVNGWLVPVMGTRTGTPPGSPNDTDTTNVIALDPPPANAGDFRTDFVFLEVWQARIAPNPSTLNKPNASSLYRYGNVEGGANYLADDLIDPALGFETAQRVQTQYRIRVVKGLLGLSSYPDGFDPSVVKAKGGYDPTNPDTQTSYTFTNMRKELGDAGLWRAGDGVPNNLGSVDGYVYAIPLAAVFRRNSVVWSGDPFPNLNGGFNRNPAAVDRTGIRTFSTTPTLNAPMSSVSTTATLVAAIGTGLPVSPATPVYIQIGNEVMTYASITGLTLGGLTRGVAGTVAESHAAGATIKVLSGRPDGLYADQVAATDILDLRHVVNPNGFNYGTLLKYNFDKLLRGELRSNWKRSGNGTQGTLVHYQDKVSLTAPALGVTKLDGPDNIRLVWSDAATVQPIEAVLKPNTNAAPSLVSVPWGLEITCNRTSAPQPQPQFGPNDILVFPVAQLKSGLPGSDVDQVRWCNEGNWMVELRIDGYTTPVSPTYYTVSPPTLTSSNDLTITLGPNFPVTDRQLYVRLYVLYGAGRGVSRIPDVPHSVELLSPSVTLLHTAKQYPANNYKLGTAFLPTWSRFNDNLDGPMRAVTAESYVDPASRSIVLQPFRLIDFPVEFRPQDGTAVNISTSGAVAAGAVGASDGTSTFTDATKNFTALGVTAGMSLLLLNGASRGFYTVVTVGPGGDQTKLTLNLPLLATEANLSYEVFRAQGLMPLNKRDGVTAKWVTTDPLGLFSGTTDPTATTKNMYITLPSDLVPKAGAVYAPLIPQDTPNFAEGLNFMFNSTKGAIPRSDADRNVIPYKNGPFSYAVFSTLNYNPPGTNPAPYNTAFTFGGNPYCGIRKFTDGRGLGRQGLELPPFYGIARLFGVYEANDYKNGSPYDAATRERTGIAGAATNLLRQNFDGPTFWIEVDDDGDATFVINADAIDLSRSPTSIPTFAAGNFAVEASIFGFDRDAFTVRNGLRQCRVVLTRATVSSGMRQQANSLVDRTANLSTTIAGPTSILPGPLTTADSVVINYSRTPYGGDAWGTQTNYFDIGQQLGPVLSGIAAEVVNNPLDQANLSLPNMKPFEVLSALTFSTTSGTGRMSQPPPSAYLAPADDAGYEGISGIYPPSDPLAARPNYSTGGTLADDPALIYLSKYNGCTERLPLGAYWRDKDFRAVLYGPFPARTQTGEARSVGGFAGLAPSSLEATSLVSICDSPTTDGSVVVHVDGNQSDYSQVTNFRTNRGGSAFVAAGDNQGGWFAPCGIGTAVPVNAQTNVLAGVAMLVRNAPTLKGATEVSAGGELMMVVMTQYQQTFGTTSPIPLTLTVSPTGMGEGYAAVDYYRIEGHPLVRDVTEMIVDPTMIQLAARM